MDSGPCFQLLSSPLIFAPSPPLSSSRKSDENHAKTHNFVDPVPNRPTRLSGQRGALESQMEDGRNYGSEGVGGGGRGGGGEIRGGGGGERGRNEGGRDQRLNIQVHGMLSSS